MRTPVKALLGLVAVGLVAAPLSACSSSKNDSGKSSGSSSSSTSAAPTTPVAKIDALTGKNTSVKLDPGFLAALKSLKLTPGVTGSAKLTSDGSLVFPITGGNVTYYTPGSVTPYVQGEIDHNGSGITLTGGGITVGLSNFIIDPGTSKLYGKVTANGKTVAEKVELFGLDGSTLQPLQADSTNGTATLTGTTVYISSDAAALLNKTYKTTAVTNKLKVGVATILINTK